MIAGNQISERMDTAIINAAELLTIDSTNSTVLRGQTFSQPEVICNGAIALEGDKILWVGKTQDLIPLIVKNSNTTIIDATKKTITPGLIDCHSHLIFGGTREDEFEDRISGKSYMEIARSGGGIKRTVNQTRNASESFLIQLGLDRLKEILALGITTLEVKSGYGLNVETELKMLHVARHLSSQQPVDIVTTFLGAHEFPTDISRKDYIEQITNQMLPAIAQGNLAEFCDIFVEQGVYTIDEAHTILTKAKDNGLDLKLHADQMSDSGSAVLATKLGAVSADHLNFISQEGMTAMAESSCIGVLLPGADFFLNLGYYPPARRMIENGVAIALATDFNPGSCMTFNLPLIMTLACIEMRMTPIETFSAVTLNAAKALNREQTIGSLSPGKKADIVIFSCPNHKIICYHFGKNHVETVIKQGKVVHGAPCILSRTEFLHRYSSAQGE